MDGPEDCRPIPREWSNLLPLNPDMTPDTIRDTAMRRFNQLAPAKYDRGQAEHGGLITDRDLLVEIEQEIVDLWFYVQAMRQKLDLLKPCAALGEPGKSEFADALVEYLKKGGT